MVTFTFQQQWLGPTTTAVNAGAEIGHKTRKTTTIRAQEDATKTAGALIGTALDGDHPAAQLKEPVAEVIVTGLAVSAESDLQAQLAKTAPDTDTAAIDTVIPGMNMKHDLLGGIVVHDHALALAHPRGHAPLHLEHWNDAAPSPRSPTHLPTWRTLQMHRRRKSKSLTSTPLVDSQPKAIQFKSRVRRASRPPKEAWRMYVFKGQDLLETVELSERSCWLVGRERMVVDFPLDHPSCSKQHAVLQFRFVEKRNEYGDRIGKVKPYLIDLESANGSSVNGETIPGGRYVEVMDKDVIRFGLSSREYVLMLPPS
ncbi:hypothetical protein N7524_009228 [Penicillium chrysogenum]|nr:hypothetical protein N7524_009228 [Penicillium chrysogenum]